MNGNEYKSPLAFYNLPRIVSRRIAGQSRHGKHEHFVPAPTFLLRSELVPPRVKTMAAAAWQVWDSVQDGVGDTIHIDYDGEYGSEWVLIVSGRAVPLHIGYFR